MIPSMAVCFHHSLSSRGLSHASRIPPLTFLQVQTGCKAEGGFHEPPPKGAQHVVDTGHRLQMHHLQQVLLCLICCS